jgi:hypothetical protein
MRFARELVFKDRPHVEPKVDPFNLTNTRAMVSRVQTLGPNYLFPTNG